MAADRANDGKVALVTGAASGIGWATARRLAETGATVVIADIDEARARERANELGPRHAYRAVDMGDREAARAMVADCALRFGRLDILVNNAGRTTSSGEGLVDQSREVFDAILAVNFAGALAAAEEAARLMAQAGGGSIVNIASGAAFRAIPFRSAYSASKAALVAASRHLAREWRGRGVRVNVVAPGFIRTELLDALIDQGKLDPSRAVAKIPLGRMGRPQEIAEAVAFLASDAACRIAGCVLSVDGGSQAFGGSGPAAPQPRNGDDRPADERAPVYAFVGEGGAIADALRARWAREGATAMHVAADPDDEAALAEAFAAIVGRFGHVDGIVHAALGAERRASGLHKLARAAGPMLLAAPAGALVALVHAGQNAAGIGGEAAVEMLSRTLACEWGPAGTRVNTLAIGALGEPATTDGLATDVAEAATFLLSPRASYVNGAVLAVGTLEEKA